MPPTMHSQASLLLNLKLGSVALGADVIGLDIQPGFVAAVEAKVNGAILAERAAALPLSGDTVREGEVIDEEVLARTLRELFDDGGLGKRVRIGVANQRTVMRTLELPPVTDRKELAAAVRFQAQDQIPMPLDDAVLDFHPLGVVDTPGGPTPAGRARGGPARHGRATAERRRALPRAFVRTASTSPRSP